MIFPLLVGLVQGLPLADMSYEFVAHRQKVKVRIHGEWFHAHVFVSWTCKGKLQGEVLSLPKGRYAINPYEWAGGQWSRPSVGMITGASSPVLWLLAWQHPDLYEFARVYCYKLRGCHWLPLTNVGGVPEFSARGSFKPMRSGIRVWDIYYDLDYAHMDYQRYDIWKYRVEGETLALITRVRTRRRYAPERTGSAVLYIPDKVPLADDPLREFGLEWTWWGPRIPYIPGHD